MKRSYAPVSSFPISGNSGVGRLNKAMVYLNSKSAKSDFEFYGSRSESGEFISADTCFALPAFLQGVRLIASSVARADCLLYKALPDGGREVDDNHIVYELLTKKVNPWQTYFVWLQGLVSNALWSGDGYSYIERDEFGTPLQLHLLDSREVYPFQEITEGKLTKAYYSLEQEGKQYILPADDVLHIRNLSLHTGLCGVSIVDQLKTVMGLNVANYKYGAVFFRHGAHVNKVLKIPGWLTKEQQDQLRDSMQSLHTGISNAHRMAVLMGGTELTTLPLDNEAAQWLESREANLTDIANILGLPATKVGARGAISYGSLEQDNLAVLSDCYDAWMTNLEAEFNAKLLTYREGWKRFIEFDRESLFTTDPAYTQNLLTQFQGKALAWEELRSKLKRTTDTKGLTFGSVPGEEPAPAPEAPQPPQGPQDQAAPPEQNADPQPAEEAPKPAEQAARAKEVGVDIINADLKQAAREVKCDNVQVDLKQDEQAASKPLHAERAGAETTVDNVHADLLPKAERLALAVLDRLRERLARAVEKDPDLSKHDHIIRDSLPDGADVALDDIAKLQAELDAVLPEQRESVVRSWDTEALARRLFL